MKRASPSVNVRSPYVPETFVFPFFRVIVNWKFFASSAPGPSTCLEITSDPADFLVFVKAAVAVASVTVPVIVPVEGLTV